MNGLNKDHHASLVVPIARTPAISVGIIILNYNTSQAVIALYEHIHALRQEHPAAPTYLVVDNASRPEQASRLSAFFTGRPNVHLILSEVNGGYARGNNLGLKKALELGLEYCLIANSDIAFLTANFMQQLVQAARTLPKCGLIGPRVVLPNGSPQGPLPETGIINGVIPWPLARCEHMKPVHATVGCCLFGPTMIFSQIGLLDEATFLYREEIILAERLRSHDLLWYYLPDVVVRHDHVRKMDSISKLMLHKKFEAQSTVYYLRRYKNRSEAAVFFYRLLLAVKTGAFIVVCVASWLARWLSGRPVAN